uniref:Transposase n=1 Tax=Pseudoalteromonas citrea DSM 8771 TaxID=1117314 RepID=U1JSZ5_9GAMM
MDATSHDIVGAELSMVNVSDGEALADLIRPLRRNSDRVTGDGAYDTRSCYEEVAAKKRLCGRHQETMPDTGKKDTPETMPYL